MQTQSPVAWDRCRSWFPITVLVASCSTGLLFLSCDPAFGGVRCRFGVCDSRTLRMPEMSDRQSEKLRTFAHLAGLLAADFSRETLTRRLRIVVAEGALVSDAGQVLALTIARLAPRFCERIDFVAPTHSCIHRLRPLLADEEFTGASLAKLADMIWPEGEFTHDSNEPVDLVLAVGGGSGDIGVGIGKDGAAIVSSDSACAVHRPDAIFAALVAAGFVSAQVAKLLYPDILKASVDPLIRLDCGPFGGMLDPARPVALTRPVLAGVGAVGCALVYALIATGTTGQLLLLDRDAVKDSNLMRYVLFDTRHLHQPKVEAAKELVEASGLDLRIDSDQTVIQSYLKANPSERERLELAVSAVDMYETRREIAGELPRAIINAGTTARDFTVSRHGFGDGYACLACLYPPREQDIERDAVTARELGLDKSEVAKLRRTKEALTVVQLTRIARARGLADDHFAGYASEPLDTFYNKEVCANLTVQSPKATQSRHSPTARRSLVSCSLTLRASRQWAINAASAWTSSMGSQRHYRRVLRPVLRASTAVARYSAKRTQTAGAMLSSPRPPDSGAASVIRAFRPQRRVPRRVGRGRSSAPQA
jgi:molybdopterin/thiamine biosynthesis adenylyltransferase